MRFVVFWLSNQEWINEVTQDPEKPQLVNAQIVSITEITFFLGKIGFCGGVQNWMIYYSCTDGA